MILRTRPANLNLPPPRVWILFGLLSVRLLFHALYVPVYEGPDEPFHLGRAAVFADESWREGFSGDHLPNAIAASVTAHPCCPDLARVFKCSPFRRTGAFNIFSKGSGAWNEASVNYEAHQPPLFYALAAVFFRAGRTLLSSPESRLLALRVLSVLLVLTALAFPIRSLARDRGDAFAVVFLLFLLLPGAAEALARGSNDAAIFLWTALVIERAVHRAGAAELVMLLAVGPLVKLTAFPVAAVITTALWLEKRRVAAAAGALASLAVVGVQALRGWSWGGTYELNQLGWVTDSTRSLATGLARSVYTFAKTVFWLGEWSFFRAPLMLVVMWFGVLAAIVAMQIRRRWSGRAAEALRPPSSLPSPSNAAGILVAVGGFMILSILNRRLFGQWGGLGGWYAWGWAPWIVVGFGPTFNDRPAKSTLVLVGFVLLSNVLWFRSAVALYGF